MSTRKPDVDLCCHATTLRVAELANAPAARERPGADTRRSVLMPREHSSTTPTRPKRASKPGMPTKRPADLSKAVKQPTGGKKPTAAMVRKARHEWGIEPYVTGGWIALKPAKGHIVHAALDAKAKQTLCTTATTWKDGATQVEPEAMDCLWCMCRIETFGAKS